ncbi:MAG: type II toxin-antitoxin system VapC family toxin [Actinomycetota bacterium]|nr:type II toxin-antitoxin system VapC family toxin [Actinomycetota bacterium]
MPADADPVLALDTSVAVPLLVQTHAWHVRVVTWWANRPVALCGHALAETYSVLTRLPGDVRLAPGDAARLMAARFSPPVLLSAPRFADLAAELSRQGVAGGAVYDALVGLAAKQHGCVLATRDARARATYQALGVDVEIVG